MTLMIMSHISPKPTSIICPKPIMSSCERSSWKVELPTERGEPGTILGVGVGVGGGVGAAVGSVDG